MSNVKLAIIFYSTYGTNHQMATIAAEAAKAAGAEVRLLRVTETAPSEAINSQDGWKATVEATRDRAGTAAIDQMPWRIPVNPDRPTEPVDMDGVQASTSGAMRILQGDRDRVPEPRGGGDLRKAGCTVDGTNVRMDEDFVMEMVARAPEPSPSPRATRPRDHHRRQAHGLRQRLVPAERLGHGARQAVRAISRRSRNS
jgi:trimethylamine:corrinoid methyltransferase-like protein